ncbi:MAG: hypothetical protein K2X02_03625 [Alphaproteobacteria bacterium]|nr:hypothetical protein [Alphaproteobacteria bacterium]
MNKDQDLPLRNDIAARFVPKIIILMVYLGTLCSTFTFFMIHSTLLWEEKLATHLSIEIPFFSDSSSNDLQTQVTDLLQKTPGINKVEVVSKTEMKTLFNSLLGEGTSVDAFSLPAIVDVSLNKRDAFNVENLEMRLKNISPLIQLIDHRLWQSQVSNLLFTTTSLALFLTFLILCSTLVTTFFATRTSLLIHRKIVEVLSLIGATPSYIAKQFQRNTFKQGFFASSIGAFLAFLTFLGIYFLFEKAGHTFVVTTSFFFEVLAIFILAPFITSFFMMLSARRAVMKALCS